MLAPLVLTLQKAKIQSIYIISSTIIRVDGQESHGGLLEAKDSQVSCDIIKCLPMKLYFGYFCIHYWADSFSTSIGTDPAYMYIIASIFNEWARKFIVHKKCKCLLNLYMAYELETNNIPQVSTLFQINPYSTLIKSGHTKLM